MLAVMERSWAYCCNFVFDFASIFSIEKVLKTNGLVQILLADIARLFTCTNAERAVTSGRGELGRTAADVVP